MKPAEVVGGLVAGLGGVALAVQGRVNGELGQALHDGFLAALVSFAGGWLVLALMVPKRPGIPRLRAALREGRIKWWQCVGGTVGAFVVSAQGLTIAMIGVAVFTIALVAGQVVSSLLVDRAGLGPASPQPLTGPRIAGATLAVVAVMITVSDEFDRPDTLWLAVLPLVAGLLIGWQQAVNGLVREVTGSSGVTTLLNFTTGTTALLVVCAVDVAVRGLPSTAPGDWWLYVGGLLGIVAVGTAIASVRYIGVLMVGLCAVAGQLVGAVLLDLAGGRLAVTTVVGTALTLVAVVVAALGRWRP